MENPLTWNKTVKSISDEIDTFYDDCKFGVCGLSLARRIYDKFVEPLEKQLNAANPAESQSIAD